MRNKMIQWIIVAAMIAGGNVGFWTIPAQAEETMNFAVRTEIAPTLLDNKDAFDTPFFRQFQLRHAPAPLDLGDGIEKNYLFPTFYTNVLQTTALFSANYAAVAKNIPTDKLKPVSVGFGRTVVIFTSYEYRTVLGIPGYREVAIAVPVVPSASFAPPLLPLLKTDWQDLGFYILSMPVTSLENRIRGRKIWGLAKDLEQIDIQQVAQDIVTQVYDEAGAKYLSFSVPMEGKAQPYEAKLNLYSILENEILTAQAQGVGEMVVTKKMLALWGFGEGSRLELGTGPKAELLRELQIHPLPFETRYAPQVSSMFDLAHQRQPR